MNAFRFPSRTYAALLAALGLGATGCSCFAAGTRVRVPGGTRTIESLRVGDAVLAFDPERGVVAERVLQTFHHRDRPLLRLVSDRGVTHTTSEHPYFTERAGFVPALALSEGARLHGFDAGPVAVGEETRVIAIAPLLWTADVWNLSISGPQTYFADDLLVHNKSPPCPDCSDYPAPCEGHDRDGDGVPWERDCDDSTVIVGECAPTQERAYACIWDYQSLSRDAGTHDVGTSAADAGDGGTTDGGPDDGGPGHPGHDAGADGG
ncbi:MAG: Hint domain-containing protein [Sandaracinaceae bacterium]|nr:Hint domain-containing protein [Sandaracinaceae bacterium]MBP7683067.1 Hint domain-containing protein [Deltaproteobacteria bacterium]MBK6813275.1 Hint domain-containing protein [Sandaracinaceae bacterium]MBK7153140.1 Hint domain-containing protein [Sandaracinaceae bacterium]MBK7773414.1 Hint domain-containing protein [Sandaracinaceae bacterium]